MLNCDVKNIMFLDIETVPSTEKFEELSSELVHLWTEKYNVLRKRLPEKYDETTSAEEAYVSSAGIYSEFGKIICISVGFVHESDSKTTFRVKSFYGEDEKQILLDFSALILKFCTTRNHFLCGHNIKEFDVPYICRRMLINGLTLPRFLQISGKKPWETPLIDTLELWKFGDIKSFAPLKLLTAVLGIPSPKNDIDGSQVAEVFYGEKDIERIVTYCQKDVVATAQVFLRLNDLQSISEENIFYL